MTRPIYFDHAATTPMHPAALEAYLDAARSGPLNPSSVHACGRAARRILTGARDRIAALLGCHPHELVFTGGGTESDNAALLGAALAQRERGRTGIVTTAVEHAAVLETCRRLQEEGFRVTFLPADEHGLVRVADAEAAIDERTAVVSVMTVNNETGARQPVEEIGAVARSRGALMHTDAVQALGYEDIRLADRPVDLASFSSHKIGGPPGVGLLYIRDGTPFRPLLRGGPQERGRRAGTENVPAVSAFARALELAAAEREERTRETERVRDALLAGFAAELPPGSWAVNGHPEQRAPHILNVSFPGVSAQTMVMNLDLAGVAVSAGAACSAGSLRPSHVLSAMGLPDERVRSAVRFSFGLGNTTEEAAKVAKLVATILARLS
ncbi:MAG: cysteine desulfurase NifS [Paenibacillaceae bacterium ZCTH02-B3]|nr:MAG: cysteine desulfurase NifS [Paenibacillaceae bacterium ZCTH02-B3]